MSLGIVPIKTVKIREPTLELKSSKQFVLFQGGQDNIIQSYSANSTSTSSSNWNINTPSRGVVVDRKIKLKCLVRVILTGPDLGQPLISSGRFAPRAFPLANAMSSLNVQINNTQCTINMSDAIKGLQHYVDERELYTEWSESPCTPDESQRYSDLVGYMRNPLNHIGDSVYGTPEPRGGYPFLINAAVTNTSADLTYEFTEALQISPLHFNKSSANGFIGLDNLSSIIQWKSDLFSAMFSRVETDGLFTSINISFVEAPKLYIRTITPSELVSQSLPTESVYGYNQMLVNQSNLPPLGPNATYTSVSDAIQLSVIPRRFVIYLMRSLNEERYDRPTTFMAIENISIQFANRSGLLSSASKKDLYAISKKNGVNLSWRNWSGENSQIINGGTTDVRGVGSVLCLYVPEDIVLYNADMLCPGVAEKTQFQITITYKNCHPTDTITPRLIVLSQSDGIFVVKDGLSYQQLGIVSPQDVMDSNLTEGLNYSDVLDLYGGDFFSNIKSFVKDKLIPGVQKGVKFVKDDILPIASAVMKVLPMLGLGITGDVKGGLIISGGKRISRKQLEKKLKEGMGGSMIMG